MPREKSTDGTTYTQEEATTLPTNVALTVGTRRCNVQPKRHRKITTSTYTLTRQAGNRTITRRVTVNIRSSGRHDRDRTSGMTLVEVLTGLTMFAGDRRRMAKGTMSTVWTNALSKETMAAAALVQDSIESFAPLTTNSASLTAGTHADRTTR
jgi:hypothetical protein